jgi:hypothetical protein
MIAYTTTRQGGSQPWFLPPLPLQMDASSLPPVGLPAASTSTAGPSGTAGAGAGAAPRTKSKAYQTTIAAEAGMHTSLYLKVNFMY